MARGEHALQQRMQPAALCRRERVEQRRQGPRDIGGKSFGKSARAGSSRAGAATAAVVTGRADRDKPLTWIEIGSVAGPVAPIPSAALSAARLQIVGSGQGSVSTREIVAELPSLGSAIADGAFAVDALPMPLVDVEQAWVDAAATTRRIVITR